ncbi:MAG: TadE/TadG family type IV pilus assembly protein [Chloroflexota bacterium]
MAEFALMVPLFFLVLMGLIEFAFGLNAMLNTNYASRGAGLIAAQVGNLNAADCLILSEIEQMTSSPAERSQISRVDIQRTNPSGSTVYAADVYTRTGSTSCTLSNGSTVTVPYNATSSGYPPSQRCTVLPPNGCPGLIPARTTVDTIAVQITYVYPWHTPLRSLMGVFGGSLSGTGFTFVQRNTFRMEPTL